MANFTVAIKFYRKNRLPDAEAADQGIHNVFAGDPVVKHVKTDGIQAELNNNMSERLQGTLRERVKALRGLKGQTTGQRYLDGWAVNCNYFRPHMAIKSTPGKAAKMESPFTSWQDVAWAGLLTPPKREHKLKRHGTASTQQCCTRMPTNYNQTVPKHAGKRREQDHDFQVGIV